MSEKTNISWTDHTFNPWWGCVKISPGCANCYADAFSKRTGHDIWGADKPRRFFGDAHWNEPVKWNAAAIAAEAPNSKLQAPKRPRVFCASMADWLEDRDDLTSHLARLLTLIHATPNLDWQLLTKRPENWRRRMEKAAGLMDANSPETVMCADWLFGGTPPPNVWIGTTVENQEYAERRIPELLKIPARVRFLSVEPMLGPVVLPWESVGHSLNDFKPSLGWVICGGESGGKRRPFEVAWAESLADQCAAARVAFFMKQDAHLLPGQQGRIPEGLWARKEFPIRRTSGSSSLPFPNLQS